RLGDLLRSFDFPQARAPALHDNEPTGWTPILNSTKIQSISSSSNRSGDPTIMALIQFTRNHTDHSTDKGFQFEFFCDRCGNGFMSEFKTSATGMAASALHAAGSFFGGVLGQA